MPKSYSLVLAFLCLGALFLAAAWYAGSQNAFMANDDFFELWLGGRLIWEGGPLYDPAGWAPLHAVYGNLWDNNPVFPYPPPVALLFAPLGLLPLSGAVVGWVFLSLWMITASVWMGLVVWVRGQTEVRLAPYFLPALAGTFLFRPVLVTLENGQLSALFLFSLALCAYLLETGRPFWGGLALALLALRPNLGLPVLAAAGLWLLLQRRWNALVGLAVSGLGLLVVSFALQPQWLQGWLQMGGDKFSNTFGYHATLWGLSGSVCGHGLRCTVILGSVAGLVLAALTLFLLLCAPERNSPGFALAVTTCLGLLIAPYLWAYDQILLVVPALWLGRKLYASASPYLVTATLPLLVSILALGQLGLAIWLGNDSLGGFLPLAVIIGLAGLVWTSSHAVNARKVVEPPL
jgi:hypothetical protein